MSAKRRSPQEAAATRKQLQDIIRDLFKTNGQLVTHDMLAKEHVRVNSSVTASEDVRLYGGLAVVHLRQDEGFAIVPVTAIIHHYPGADTASEAQKVDTVAGLGAGGPRIGWYQPTDADDPLWAYYLGHQAKSGMHLIFHAATQADKNPALTGPTLIDTVGKRALPPAPAGESEKQVLAADIGR